MLRAALLILLFGSVAGLAQDSPQNPAKQLPVTATPQSVSQQVADAEAAIVKSDWKTAQAKLDLWLSAHADDPRAVFDAGYVADAQNRLEDATAFYRRAVAADPKSFEAHLSLGLLLARQSSS